MGVWRNRQNLQYGLGRNLGGFVMESEWITVSLKEIAEPINTGLDAITRAPIVSYPTSIKCLRIQDISNNKRFDQWGFTDVKPTDYEKYRLKRGEIIMARTCSTGINYLVKEDLAAVFNNGLARIRLRRDVALPEYVYYVFQSQAFADYIAGISGGTSVQLNMKVGDLANFQFKLPHLKMQRKISTILGALDDKIEQNRRTGAKLEGLARAVFKAWFVDFEPVKAKAAGATAFPGMPPETFAALPARFEDAEFGPAPQGWNVETLREMATFITGGTPSKANPIFWNGTFPWVSAKDMHGRIVSDSELRLSDAGRNSVRRIAPRHSTLMVIRGMSLMSEVRIGWCAREVAFNQDLRAFIARGDTTPEFIHLWLTSSEETLMQMVDTASHGTGRILTDRLDAMAIARPPKTVMQSFTEMAKPIMALRESLHTESAKLAALRDYLLPRLLSGQVRVGD